ncbi:class I SAM-dependent methyltransferase [uncultured Draconibacterium sp.]|uniref:class I SAM-dependent methyltransferase n=1 Tax=uncultured Draconibacterium sp. TaxID=1573823 RepID=UPI0032602B24
MNNFWDERYSSTEYAYGIEPNEYYKQNILELPPGKALFPAEGEGRNAVFAAKLGWDVTAFDPSIKGNKKANRLASEHNVSINYIISDYQNVSFEQDYFDCLCLTFAHMPGKMRENVHRKLASFLKPGGSIILEAFSKEQISKNTGGPRDIDFLFSKKELKSDFANFSSLSITETETQLNEGAFHQGISSVIRLVGIK